MASVMIEEKLLCLSGILVLELSGELVNLWLYSLLLIMLEHLNCYDHKYRV